MRLGDAARRGAASGLELGLGQVFQLYDRAPALLRDAGDEIIELAGGVEQAELPQFVHLHFTPTYSLWLHQVELWFAKIERDLLARGVFTSVADLARKIRRLSDTTTRRRTSPLELSQSGASN